MLTIRQAQMDVLIVGMRSRFEADLVSHFLRVYPRESAEAGGKPQIENPWAEAALASPAGEVALIEGLYRRANRERTAQALAALPASARRNALADWIAR
ncbi:MAG: hypothetical protein ABSG03_04225 [Bryobacteraceae bacterium]|jgi:hypothetical protein